MTAPVRPGPPPDWAGALARARAEAPFLAGLIERDPAQAAALAAGRLDLVPGGDPAEPVARRLRRERRRLALGVAVGDLAGALDLTAVTAALTGFADWALDLAITAAFAERYPGEPPRGLAVLALGKQGSRELNYSSDVDPVILFDPATLPRRAREEPGEAAVRLARRVVELLQARDADGYALRVDLRLRPSPEATPIALPVDYAVAYYESQALPWERAAFIRARAAAGDQALGERFLAAIAPFVWRRRLDFGAVGELRAITARIRAQAAAPFGPGFDLKRGRGGIREAEFFAQVHQLVHGGRDPGVRAPATRDALAALAAAGRIDAGDAATVADAYAILRTIEHRVQMVDDRQTHALPPAGPALDRVARLHGLADGAGLLALLAPRVAGVATRYDALDADAPAALPGDPVALAASLAAAGFADPVAARARVETWRGGRYPALRSPAARAALEAALPALVPALAAAPVPAAALNRLDGLLERLPSAVDLFRLLAARPALATLLTAVLSHAPPLADALARSPVLLDGLIDASALDPVDGVAALAARMGAGAGDYPARLDQARRVVGEARFALGAQLVSGVADPLEVAAGYARVAEAAVASLAGAAAAEFAAAHGRVPGGEPVVLGLGRLGGGALTHASDLDLVFLFTGDHRAASDGARPLGATLYHNRLASRVVAALSVATAAGPLYPVDTRLRPSGEQGPLAVTLASFERYQRAEAWTWEHMALCRARPVHGSPAARAAAQAVIDAVLMGEGGRPERDVAADARAMRERMAAHKPPAGPLDAKLLPGGLVDLEFAVHVVQLTRRTGFDPDLGRAIDALVAERLLPAGMRRAHDFLTRLLVALRLFAPDALAPAPATRALVARSVGLADWETLLAWLDDTRRAVGAVWERVAAGG